MQESAEVIANQVFKYQGVVKLKTDESSKADIERLRWEMRVKEEEYMES